MAAVNPSPRRRPDMPTVVITGCRDHLMWYARRIGKAAPLIRDLPTENSWLVREPSGHSNVLRYEDGLLMPAGFELAAQGTAIEQHDLIEFAGGWFQAPLQLIGQISPAHIVIRKVST